MSTILTNDIRSQYEKSFTNIRKIIEAFPEDRWLEYHGDEYYIPSRIAYHLVGFIDGFVAGGNRDPDFRNKAPFGSWIEGTAATLPKQDALLSYFDEVIIRANKELAVLDDESLAIPLEPEKARMGACQMGIHMYSMRELAAHTGELNKMLVENGKDDIWVSR